MKYSIGFHLPGVLLCAAAAAAAGCSSRSSNGGGAAADSGGDAESAAVTYAKSFGGPGFDAAAAAIPTSDGGVVFVGRIDGQVADGDDPAGESDLSITKLDASGDLEWTRAIGEIGLRDGGRIRSITSAHAVSDGGLVLVGDSRDMDVAASTGHDLWIAKMASDGTLLWSREHDTGPWPGAAFAPAQYGRGAFADDHLDSVWQLPDGGFVASGSSVANLIIDGIVHLNAEAPIVFRFDALGNVVWQRHLTEGQLDRSAQTDDPRGEASLRVTVRGTADHGAVVAYDWHEQRFTARVVRFNSGGDVVWTTDVREPHDFAVTFDADQAPADGARDDGIVLVDGSSITKLARDGSLQWRRPDDLRDTYSVVEQTCRPPDATSTGFDCGYIVAGTMRGPDSQPFPGTAFIARLADDGELVVRRELPQFSDVSSVIVTDDGDFVVAAAVAAGPGQDNTRVVLDASMLNVLAVAEPESVTRGRAFLASPTDLIERRLEGITWTSWPSLLATEPARDEVIELAQLGGVDAGFAVVEVAPGSYIVGGQSSSFGDRLEPWVIRITNGQVDWQRRFDLAWWLTSIHTMALASDGGLVLGVTENALVKLTADGQAQWSAPLFGLPSEIHALADGEVVVGIVYESLESAVARFDAAGNAVWRRVISSTAVHSLAPVDDDGDGDADDGFVVAGPGRVQHGLFVVEKMNRAGETLWTRELAFRGAALAPPGVVKIRPTPDGGYVVATTEIGALTDALNHPLGESNILLVKLDRDGNPIWSRSYGAFLDERLHDLRVTPDGGHVIAASSDSLGDRSEAWILRLGPDGMLDAGCNAYLGSLPIEAFDVSSPDAGVHTPEDPIFSAFDPPTSTETAALVRTPETVVARQCLGLAAPPGPPLVPAPKFDLTLTQPGSATGVITSTPAGLICGTASRPPPCTAAFAAGEPVFLDVDFGSVGSFVRFEGCDELIDDASGAASCRVQMDRDREVRAIFGEARDRFELRVTVLGVGTVRSGDPNGISCGVFYGSAQDCEETYDALVGGTTEPTSVTLGVFTHADGFLGWGGDCAAFGTQPSFALVMDADKHCTAMFAEPPAGFDLTLETTGTGMGSIVSAPSGISCPAVCTAGFPVDQTVRLLATEGQDSVFDGWVGCDRLVPPPAGSIPICEIDLTTDRTIGAAFARVVGSQYRLEVVVTGADGIVESSDHGVICTSSGPDCQEVYAAGSSVGLTATLLRGGGTFMGWGGDCAPFGSAFAINLLMNGDKTCTAQFSSPPAPPQATLTITKIGGGIVLSTPAGIDCGTACTAQFATNQTVRLAAVPTGPFIFSGWSGCDRHPTGGNAWPDCELDMATDRTVQARFE